MESLDRQDRAILRSLRLWDATILLCTRRCLRVGFLVICEHTNIHAVFNKFVPDSRRLLRVMFVLSNLQCKLVSERKRIGHMGLEQRQQQDAIVAQDKKTIAWEHPINGVPQCHHWSHEFDSWPVSV